MKLFELFDKQPLRENKMLNESIKLCKSVVALLEADGGFDFEPDPAFAGVKGINRDTGVGNKAAADAKHQQANQKLNATWQKLLQKLRTLDPHGKAKLQVYLKQVVAAAEKRGFELSPAPSKVLGL